MRHRVSRQFRMHGFHLGFGWGHASANTCSENSVLGQWPWTEPDPLRREVTRGLVLPHLLASTRWMWGELFSTISRLRLIISLVLKPCSRIVRLFWSERFNLDQWAIPTGFLCFQNPSSWQPATTVHSLSLTNQLSLLFCRCRRQEAVFDFCSLFLALCDRKASSKARNRHGLTRHFYGD